MAGIYFHIPFCKQACHYCDFHFSTSLKYKEELLLALKNEFIQRKNYIESSTIESIYFGGGSPSILKPSDIQTLIDSVHQFFDVASDAEISLEANPDDLYSEKVKGFKNTDINRFSIGIQSFFDEDLKWMNRAHTSQEADACIKRVQDAGFENITCDLIYGFPLLTEDKWAQNIDTLVEFDVPHLSCYGMTVEPKTALAKFIKVGKTAPMSETQAAKQFIQLIKKLEENHYTHYEISNFAKNNHFAQHNTNYWKGVPYLGIGPSAHSFNGSSRSWNISNNALYIKKVGNREKYWEEEQLSLYDRFNENIMTSLRTMWGIDLNTIKTKFGETYKNYLLKEAQPFLAKKHLTSEKNTLKLTSKGKLLADYIASELFLIE